MCQELALRRLCRRLRPIFSGVRRVVLVTPLYWNNQVCLKSSVSCHGDSCQLFLQYVKYYAYVLLFDRKMAYYKSFSTFFLKSLVLDVASSIYSILQSNVDSQIQVYDQYRNHLQLINLSLHLLGHTRLLLIYLSIF